MELEDEELELDELELDELELELEEVLAQPLASTIIDAAMTPRPSLRLNL